MTKLLKASPRFIIGNFIIVINLLVRYVVPITHQQP